ncbi:immunity protein TriTu family protein [Streptomyces orinoci]|uniref:Uncharacterized protein n=1 Tax=Streptomyces orinoci TaxID=67339 RepID=A0ABV3JVC8_STRON|nr:hypothetical protein [Streptomyces orinoci]
MDDNSATLRQAGWEVTLDVTRVEWQERSVSLAIDNEQFVGQFTFWGSGAIELACAEVATGELWHEHREAFTEDNLREALEGLLNRLGAVAECSHVPDSGRRAASGKN